MIEKIIGIVLNIITYTGCYILILFPFELEVAERVSISVVLALFTIMLSAIYDELQKLNEK